MLLRRRYRTAMKKHCLNGSSNAHVGGEIARALFPRIDFELHLASHEGKAAAQLQQKIKKMLEESPLQLPFFGARVQGQKLERVGVP